MNWKINKEEAERIESAGAEAAAERAKKAKQVQMDLIFKALGGDNGVIDAALRGMPLDRKIHALLAVGLEMLNAGGNWGLGLILFNHDDSTMQFAGAEIPAVDLPRLMRETADELEGRLKSGKATERKL